MRLRTCFLASALCLALTTPALAGEEGGPSAVPEQTDSLTLPTGKLVVNALLEINLSKSAAFKPVSLSPDIWYGVNDDLTLGLVHSTTGTTGFLGGVGDSLCLAGSSNGCAHVYDNVGIDARYRLKAPFAIDGGLYAFSFDPFSLAAKIGGNGRWRFDRLAVEAAASLFIGFTHRDPGNKDLLAIPVTVSYEVAERIEVAGQLGFFTQLEEAGDNYRFPFSLAARYQVTSNLGAGLVFSLPALIGSSSLAGGRGFDARVLTLGGSYAL